MPPGDQFMHNTKLPFLLPIENKKMEIKENDDVELEIEKEENETNICKFCNDSFHSSYRYEKHVSSCKIYYKFNKKTSHGFQCVFCSKEYSKQVAIFAHIGNSEF